MPPAFCCFGAAEAGLVSLASEAEEVPATSAPAPDPDEGLTRVHPVIRTYLHPGDATSFWRYFLLFTAVGGGLSWWLGPVMGIFVVDPLLQLMLLEGAVITPDVQCFDFRLESQVCDADIFVDYYFWNITNADQWASGAAPPAYEQVGPFAFKAKEVRYNVQYSADWSEVSFTYHQWAEFQPDKSCAGCDLGAPLTGVNRGYLQFLAAPTPPGLDPESGVIYGLMPLTLGVIYTGMRAAVAAANPLSPTIDADVVRQWTDCSFLQPLQAAFGMPNPYLKDVPLPPGTPGFPFNPELCAFIPPAAQAAFGIAITPADFATYGLNIDYGAAGTFLTLAIGGSNATYLDPAAAQFVGGFLTLDRAALLAAVGAASPAAAASLGGITAAQWPVLQGYLASLVPSWGSLVFSGWLAAGGGGLITTKSVETWMNGFDDPLLLTAAQGAAAAAGAPEAYRLAPWLYRPSLALSFSTREEPLEYFSNLTGSPYDYSQLSWNSSDLGGFLPLIQQKRMRTGRRQGSAPQDMLQYRGLPFANKTWGILNVTGVSEGVAFGNSFDPGSKPVAWDSVLSRPMQAEFTGFHAKVKNVDTLVFNMTPSSVAACNWTAYGDWAGAVGFDPDAYAASVNAIPPQDYGRLMANDTALREYLEAGPLGAGLGQFYAQPDVYVDRCAQPERFAGTWDMSSMLACPTLYTFPHFYAADPAVVESTGVNASAWGAEFGAHGYALAVEPSTGFAIRAQKTYQVNHMVARTANLFPQLWVADGTAAAAGATADFVTVPTYWVRMWWEPTDSAALMIRVLAALSDTGYYLLVVCAPILGWLALGPALFMLRFTRAAKARRAAAVEEQRSRARPARLTQHERAMVAALEAAGRGEAGVELPEPLPEGTSELSEAALEAAEGGASPAPAAAAPPSRGKSSPWDRSPRVGSARVAPADAAALYTSVSVGKETPLLLCSAGSSSGSEAALLPDGGAGSAGAPPPSRLGRSRGGEE